MVNIILSKLNSKLRGVGRTFSWRAMALQCPSLVELIVPTMRHWHYCLPTSDSWQGRSPEDTCLQREVPWQENTYACSLGLFYLYFFSPVSFFHDYSLVLVDGILQTTFHPPLINPGWMKLIQLLHDWLWILCRSFSDNSSSALEMSSLRSWIPVNPLSGSVATNHTVILVEKCDTNH